MEYNIEKKEITINKELNELDKFVVDFISVLKKHVDYVVVSGYVSILLGRSRGSEDVDLLIPVQSKSEFENMFRDLNKNEFECANTSKIDEAQKMLSEHAIRFYKGVPVPNIEFKQISDEIQQDALENKIKVIVGDNVIYISPLELQIAYKLFLMAPGNIGEISSDKDFEDAKHLYELFKEDIDIEKINKYIKYFSIEDKWELLKNE